MTYLDRGRVARSCRQLLAAAPAMPMVPIKGSKAQRIRYGPNQKVQNTQRICYGPNQNVDSLVQLRVLVGFKSSQM